jgi:hypothetical protein
MDADQTCEHTTFLTYLKYGVGRRGLDAGIQPVGRRISEQTISESGPEEEAAVAASSAAVAAVAA